MILPRSHRAQKWYVVKPRVIIYNINERQTAHIGWIQIVKHFGPSTLEPAVWKSSIFFFIYDFSFFPRTFVRINLIHREQISGFYCYYSPTVATRASTVSIDYIALLFVLTLYMHRTREQRAPRARQRYALYYGIHAPWYHIYHNRGRGRTERVKKKRESRMLVSIIISIIELDIFPIYCTVIILRIKYKLSHRALIWKLLSDA